jgi:oligoendopeptidase F
MKAHAMAERGESLDQAALCAIYKDLIKQYFGEDLVIDDEVQYEWSRIPHFYRPFYVFVYSTGYCTASALSQMILSEGKPAVDRYIDFLKMGSSAYPIDELIHAGVEQHAVAFDHRHTSLIRIPWKNSIILRFMMYSGVL